MEPQFVKCPLKGDLLIRLTERFPDAEPDSIEAMTTLQSVSKSLTAIMNQPLEDEGMSEGRFFVLMFLFSEELMGNDTPGPSDIAEHLGVTRATVTGLLDGLERDGYVERQHDSADRRALTIAMTDKTRTCLDEFAPTQARVIKQLLSPLTAEEKQTLIHLLSKIDPQSRSNDIDTP